MVGHGELPLGRIYIAQQEGFRSNIVGVGLYPVNE